MCVCVSDDYIGKKLTDTNAILVCIYIYIYIYNMVISVTLGFMLCAFVRQKYISIYESLVIDIEHYSIIVVYDSPMTRIMDLPKGYINQELSW